MLEPTTESTPPRKLPRHLMDPDNPRPRSSGGMSLSQVQRWVLSTLAVFTILHMSAGLVIAAMAVEDGRTDARIGLNVIAGLFGVMAVVTGRLIHQRSPITPWLVLGVVPTAIGLWLTF